MTNSHCVWTHPTNESWPRFKKELEVELAPSWIELMSQEEVINEISWQRREKNNTQVTKGLCNSGPHVQTSTGQLRVASHHWVDCWCIAIMMHCNNVAPMLCSLWFNWVERDDLGRSFMSEDIAKATKLHQKFWRNIPYCLISSTWRSSYRIICWSAVLTTKN